MNNNDPIVFCHGLLGWGKDGLYGYPYYVCAEKLKEEKGDKLPPLLFPSTGPVSSLYDQACELFFQLKGGLTDYGDEHSRKFGHKRYTRFYGEKADFDPVKSTKYGGKPLYPQWDEKNPLDFVGHSMGAPLIRMLQYLLAEDYFCMFCGYPEHTSSIWVHSVSTVAGAHNGTPLTWILGADENTGMLSDNAQTVRFLCNVLKLMGRYQNKNSGRNPVFDLHLDQWELDDSLTPDSILKQLAEKKSGSASDFYNGKDWAMYDLTPNAMEIHNRYLTEYPETWYFSYTTQATFSLFGSVELFIPFICHFVLCLNSLLLGNYRTRNKKWKDIVRTWHLNDGMCPTEGQKYPRLGRETVYKPHRKKKERDSTPEKIKKGSWNVIPHLPLMDHAEPAMMPHWYRMRTDRRFYEELVTRILNTRNING
jgi:triacylglycerol lipase